MSRLKKEVIDIVKSRYEILEIIDLLEYDHQIEQLDCMLSQYADCAFKENQRIIILHNDTDYYVSLQASGFTLYNLFLLFKKHSIPIEFLIMFTNHHSIYYEVEELSLQLCNSTPLKVIYTEMWGDYPDSKDILTNDCSQINKLFCCLNGVNRSHRLLTLCYFKEYNLLSQGMISYHFSPL
jgi:hypothetical protein